MFWQTAGDRRMGVAMERTTYSVWAAEHGASTTEAPEPRDADGANAGHRFRIHGRLRTESLELLPGEATPIPDDSADEGERVRVLLAHITEIDLSDVHIEVADDKVEISGTVSDDGERRQLPDLVAQLIEGKTINSQLRPRNP